MFAGDAEDGVAEKIKEFIWGWTIGGKGFNAKARRGCCRKQNQNDKETKKPGIIGKISS
jgi:hypothetical protein